MPRLARDDQRLPSLDGLRAVSISLVICSHFAYAHPELSFGIIDRISDGYLGVRIFFVISGFLITTLLIEERKQYGFVSLKNFYLRRALRLFPVQYVFVVFVYVLTVLTPARLPLCSFVTALTFTKNYACGEWIDGHFWSLAVEEQFYLVWPVAFLVLRDRGAMVFATALILVAPASRVLEYVLGYRQYDWLTSNADALMVGGLLALFAAKNRGNLEEAMGWHPAAMRTVAMLLMYAPFLLGQHLVLGKFTVTFGPSLQAICAGYLIASLAFHPYGLAFKFLNSRVVAFVGVISYSLYVWQMPFLALPRNYGGVAEWFLKFPTDLGLVVIAALASYCVLERPLAALRRKLRVHRADWRMETPTLQPRLNVSG